MWLVESGVALVAVLFIPQALKPVRTIRQSNTPESWLVRNRVTELDYNTEQQLPPIGAPRWKLKRRRRVRHRPNAA